MPDSTTKDDPRNPRKSATKPAPKDASKDAPQGLPAPQDDADECETNDGNPSDGKRKPKCHEGYPEQQPTDIDQG